MAATRWKGSTEQRNLRQFQTSLHNKSGIKIIFMQSSAVGWRADSTGSLITSAKRQRALVDAAPSYLIRMAFRSTLSGDGRDIVRGLFLPGATISQGDAATVPEVIP